MRSQLAGAFEMRRKIGRQRAASMRSIPWRASRPDLIKDEDIEYFSESSECGDEG